MTEILHSPAFFWDGTTQLPGVLQLRSTELVFKFSDFKHSHLNLNIPLRDVESARVFMIFNISKNGLRIDSRNDKIDLFVLEDCKGFCEVLLREMKKKKESI